MGVRTARYTIPAPAGAQVTTLVVQCILAGVELLCAKSALEAAELAIGSKMADDVWRDYGPQWERAWTHIIR
jgi:hypothetical protein